MENEGHRATFWNPDYKMGGEQSTRGNIESPRKSSLHSGSPRYPRQSQLSPKVISKEVDMKADFGLTFGEKN